ncbi:MAG: SusC/RagA family TonB-linked outer membrane protein [Leadbetterella sp.]
MHVNIYIKNFNRCLGIVLVLIVLSYSAISQSRLLKGTVTEVDKNGNTSPLIGVTVKEKYGNNASITDLNGEYSISIGSNTILEFSFIGYTTQTIPVKNLSRLDVTLESDTQTLDEVVVTGYQKIDRANFTGAAVKLKTEDIKLPGAVDVARMLDGRASGVSVQTVSGTFGAAPKIRIRGATSITGDNKPLWVIDGVVLEDVINITNDDLASGNVNTLLGSAVAGLNSNDIESFQILKDASATALYGARAMNGVIVVTTKKGRIMPTTVTYSNNFSYSPKPSYNNFSIMNSTEQMAAYAEMENKGLLTYSDVSRRSTSGVYGKMYDLISSYNESNNTFGLENTPAARNAYLQQFTTVNTDWFNLLFRNNLTQEHSLGIMSGSQGSQYYFSTSVFDDKGVSIAEKVRRYTATMRANYTLGKRVNLGFITVGSYRDQRAPGAGDRDINAFVGRYERDFDINPYNFAQRASRTIPAYNSDGSYFYIKNNYAPFNIIEENEYNRNDITQLDLKFQSELGIKLFKNLSYDVLGTIRYVNTTTENKVHENSNQANAYRANENSVVRNNNKFLYSDPENPESEPQVVLPRGGLYNSRENKLVNYYARHQVTYSKDFNPKNSVNVLVGQEIKYADRQNTFFSGYGYQYDKGGVPFTDYRILKKDLDFNFNYFGSLDTRDRFVAFYSNGSYVYNQKYTLNLTGRVDGSNQLGKSIAARWLPTWNVSGSWNAKEESFLKNSEKISRLSLRGTFGLTANIGNANNSTAIYQDFVTNRPFLTDKEPQIGIRFLENSELTWEKQYETNFGFDLGLWRNKLSIILDAYQRRGFDLIGTIRTSGIGGEFEKLANYADMSSRGIDASLNYKIIEGKKFNWNTNINFSFNKNEITDLASIPQILDLIKEEGGPQKGYPVRGLFSLDFQGLSENGIPQFIDETGETSTIVDVQSNETQYLKFEGSVDPTRFGGWSNTVQYSNWEFNVFVSYQGGNKIRRNSFYNEEYSDFQAFPKEFKNRWVLPGDEEITTIPVILDAYTNSQLDRAEFPMTQYNRSSARVASGDFVRLKNISVSYIFPSKYVKFLRLKDLSVRFSGTNLALLYSDKKLQGQDPEFFGSGGVALPVPRQFIFSLKTSL